MSSFFSKIESFFKKVFGSVAWQQTASAVLTLILPLLKTVLTLVVGEGAADAVTAIVNEVISDLGTVSVLITQSQGDPSVIGTIGNLLNAVVSNLTALLSAGHIKDTATLSKVTAIVNTVVGEAGAILKVLPTPPPVRDPANPLAA
jgi:hypothetical protein